MCKSKENPNLRILAGSSFDKINNERIMEYRLKWRENPVRHVAGRFPIHLDIEATSICNLKCPFCATAHEKYSKGYMSMALYKRIIDEGSEKGLYSIKLNFRGEPLLHPEIGEMIFYAKQKGIVDVFFNTNATVLTEEAAERLMDSGLDRIIVSFEGFTKEIYEKNRVGAKFENVISNIRNFAGRKKRLNSIKPLLRLQTVDIDTEESYLERYREFWKDYADEITCIDLRDERADYTDLKGDGWECPYPWRRLCITWDGEVYTCPFMNRAVEKYRWRGFGNINEVSLEGIWSGDVMRTIRKVHKDGLSHTIEPCKYCSYRGTELLKRNDKAKTAY